MMSIFIRPIELASLKALINSTGNDLLLIQAANKKGKSADHIEPERRIVQVLQVLLVQHIIGIQKDAEIRVDLIGGAKIQVGKSRQHLVAGLGARGSQVSVPFSDIEQIGR